MDRIKEAEADLDRRLPGDLRETIDDLPAGSILIAANGTGELLLLLADGDDIAWWDHETGDSEPVVVNWS